MGTPIGCPQHPDDPWSLDEVPREVSRVGLAKKKKAPDLSLGAPQSLEYEQVERKIQQERPDTGLKPGGFGS